MSKAVGIEEKHSFTLTWDLDIDTNDTTTDVRLPLATRFGDVDLTVKVTAAQDLDVRFGFDGCESGCFGGDFQPWGSLSFLDAKQQPVEMSTGSWSWPSAFPKAVADGFRWGLRYKLCGPSVFDAADSKHPKFDRATQRRFRVVFKFSDVTPPASTLHALRPKHLAQQTAPSVTTQQPHNVRFFFPRTSADLWASSSFLSSASPYWKTLLNSDDFAETISHGKKRPRTTIHSDAAVLPPQAQGPTPPQDSTVAESAMSAIDDPSALMDDSDEEADDVVKGASTGLEDEVEDGPSYRQVKITQTSFSTYRAVLLWLHTSFIAFSSLSSSTSHVDRIINFDTHIKTTPDMPLPVSPKAVYRLAHLLELPQLMALSLANLKSQLTVENAATELFSETSATYDDLRAVVLDFVVEHWKDVKASEGMKEVEKKSKAREMPWSGAVYAELLPRLI